MIILEMLSYPFLARAMLVGVLVSLCSALLGTPLVLKRYSMIGDGLSHVGFGALAIASAFGWAPLAVAVPVVVVSAVVLLRVSQSRSAIKGDAAVALISSGALAVGVLVISLTSGVNTNVSNYMFGSILTVSRSDAALSVILCAAVLVSFTLFYPRLFAVTFDETFARATGAGAGIYNTLLAVLTAVTVVLGMRMMGALLISSLIIFPPLAAMRVFRSFKSVTVCSAVLSVACFVTGMTASYALETPSGASVVCADILAFAAFALAGRIRDGGK
ncbi:MAG TPA: metal ABC transporter permease [Candidatus Scatomorpha stercoravium]|nr:metal ABC transporter permease [Candidatus Scatomorpha stercoravium]